MLLAVDVGNTTTRFGLFADGDGTGASAAAAEPLGTWEVTTPERLTADEARLSAMQALAELPSEGGHPQDAILSCVVPSLEAPWTQALAAATPARPLVVGPGLKTGMRLQYDDPSEIGPDRIADAVAARERYGAPAIVVDLGTTTNIEVIDGAGAFAGGLIAPGLALGARSLSDAAARLPVVDLRAPQHVIGKSTREAMRAGIVLGEAARIDGLLDMVASELAVSAAHPAVLEGSGSDVLTAPLPIILTGDNAAAMAAILRHEATVDDTLTLRGLAMLHRLNRRR